MSLSELFEHFPAKPKTITWVIEGIERSSERYWYRYSQDIKLSSQNLSMRLHIENSGNDFFWGGIFDEKNFIVTFNFDSNYNSSIYYRISLINEKGQKCNTQCGRTKRGFNAHYSFNRDYVLDKSNGFFPDEKLTIYCEVYELDDHEGMQSCIDKDNLPSLSRDNQTLLESEKLCDVVLAVGDRELKAHKLILSTRSVVFKKMFEHDLEESKRNRVDITDISAGAVEDLLKFIYTGKVSDLKEHVYELFVAADKYQIDSLKSYCELYLTLSLSTSTLPDILQFIDDSSEKVSSLSLDELKSKCINYITRHKTEFNFNDWQKLTACKSALMYQLWQGNDPN